MTLLSKIGSAAAREESKSAAGPVGMEALLPDPDLSSIPDDRLDAAAQRITVREMARRVTEDEKLSGLREQYASRIFNLTIVWLAVVIFVVVLSGVSLPVRSGIWAGIYQIKFELPEAVLIAFIGTTTVNVIALFLAVTAWLFPKTPGVHVEPKGSK